MLLVDVPLFHPSNSVRHAPKAHETFSSPSTVPELFHKGLSGRCIHGPLCGTGDAYQGSVERMLFNIGGFPSHLDEQLSAMRLQHPYTSEAAKR